mgnify:CR=1 FL=1
MILQSTACNKLNKIQLNKNQKVVMFCFALKTQDFTIARDQINSPILFCSLEYLKNAQGCILDGHQEFPILDMSKMLRAPSCVIQEASRYKS